MLEVLMKLTPNGSHPLVTEAVKLALGLGYINMFLHKDLVQLLSDVAVKQTLYILSPA
jgi:hypothetical protein